MPRLWRKYPFQVGIDNGSNGSVVALSDFETRKKWRSRAFREGMPPVKLPREEFEWRYRSRYATQSSNPYTAS
jgi:hypothetical protein